MAETAHASGRKLYAIGHIFGVTRLSDFAMEDEGMVRKCVARFESHDYTLGLSDTK